MKPKYVIAVILILLGVGLLMDQYSVWTFGKIISTWWPLILIGIGISLILNSRESSLGGAIITLLGLAFQADKLNLLPGNVWGYFWPLVLIILGTALLMGKRKSKGANFFRSDKTVIDDDIIKINTMFSGIEQRVHSQNFKGGTVNCAFGGAMIDLSSARLSGSGAEFNMSIAFGGVELRVPRDIKIDVYGSPFLGGYEDKTRQEVNSNSPVLKIKYSVAFGGLEIKN